jgi:hypothetical protein
MAYTGLPLDIFGRDAMFQPYLPLQQLDMMKETKSWLCGSTNSIVTQSKEIDLLVNVSVFAFVFVSRLLWESCAMWMILLTLGTPFSSRPAYLSSATRA